MQILDASAETIKHFFLLQAVFYTLLATLNIQ